MGKNVRRFVLGKSGFGFQRLNQFQFVHGGASRIICSHHQPNPKNKSVCVRDFAYLGTFLRK